ncbi:serine--tRNA ligase [Microbacteriaceae bacterium]|nr:serine--tRNA ligase [Candidatus Saccharibacteria bacterium]
MLDIRYIRENSEKVQNSAHQKGYSNVDISELLKLDSRRRELQQQADELRTKRNEVSSRLKGGRPDSTLIEEGKVLKTKLAEHDVEFKKVDEAYRIAIESVPNVIFDDVPLGGEDDSVEIKQVGVKTTGAKDHLDFALARDWVDFERGAKVAGAKFYFLKDELALLEQALIQYAISFVTARGFRFMTVPNMVNTKIAEGAGFAPKGDASGNEYFVEDTEMTMIGTAEAPLTGYHADEILDAKDLPLLYAGLSPCYRKEAGTYGKHTRGLFRVHQFNKLEMYAFTLPEDSKVMHERILALEEELWQSLGIAYHVINIAAGDLGAPAAKKFDIEYWSPVDQTYRELTSCSNCTDFQARNLNIRVRREDGSIDVVHTLNGTAVSLARSLITVIENYQNEDGTLTVPEVLRPYMGGRTKI